jgi:hypothetical protein
MESAFPENRKEIREVPYREFLQRDFPDFFPGTPDATFDP